MSVDLSVASLTFDGLAPAFAERAGVAFEAALAGAAGLQAGPRDVGLLVLDGLDFTTPERLGESLARAILREVAR
jgi:hypothetical protein